MVGTLFVYACQRDKRMYPDASELNGIAFDANENTLLVTGKLWPKTYVVRIY